MLNRMCGPAPFYVPKSPASTRRRHIGISVLRAHTATLAIPPIMPTTTIPSGGRADQAIPRARLGWRCCLVWSAMATYL